MASCGLCNSFGRTKIQYNDKLARHHAETHFLQMKIIDDGITTDQIFEKCFPVFVGSANSGRKDLHALCHSLFPRKLLTDMSPRIICEKCDEVFTIIYRRRTVLAIDVIIEHACYHLGHNVYECRHCIQEFRTRSMLSRHLAAIHQLRTAIGHYRSNVDDFVGEISTMIKACFGNRKQPAHQSGMTIRPMSISRVRGLTRGSHLAVERQLFCHRLIWKMADGNRNVHCRLCSKGIKVDGRGSQSCANIKEHAYRHMATPLYRCRPCSKTCFDRSSVGNHLRVVHALPCLEKNFDCLADQYHTEVLAMMDKCYGNEGGSATEIAFRNLSETRIGKKSSPSELATRRQLLCYRLLRKCVDADGLVQCHLCSKQMTAGNKTANSFSSTNAMQHAFLHLGKMLYQCSICPNSFVNRSGVKKHLEQEHACSSIIARFNFLSDQFHDDIERILRQCYGDEDDALEEAPTSTKREPGESTSVVPSRLMVERQALCNQLGLEHIDQKDQRIQCRLCNKRITVCCSGVRSGSVMAHALMHLDKPLYRCKICSEMCITRGNVGYHLRTKHDLPMTNNYECLGDQFHAEIVQILRKCYNEETAKDAKPFKSRSMGEAKIRINVSGSKQAVERQLFCYRLLREFVDSDGKIECRVCKKRIAAVRGRGTHFQTTLAMMHATVHLKKLIYRCVVCSEKFPHSGSIIHHLKQAHALPSANNYESLADEYHLEILAQIRECYGEL